MLDPTTRAVYNAATTPVARAQFRSGYADGDEGEIGGGGEFPQPPPVLSAAAVSGVTKTSATPRVTLTF